MLNKDATDGTLRELGRKKGIADRCYANQKLSSTRDKNGNLTAKLWTVPSYSTKLLSPQDQLLLAVDKVVYTEIKPLAVPFHPHGGNISSSYGEVPIFVSSIALQGNDKKSLSLLLNGIHPNKSFSFEFNGTETMPTKLNTYMMEGDSDNICFAFDSFDGGMLSGFSDVPSLSALFGISRIKGSNRYTDSVEWKYDILIHTADMSKVPDAVLKDAFDRFKGAMRASLSFFGIIPSKL